MHGIEFILATARNFPRGENPMDVTRPRMSPRLPKGRYGVRSLEDPVGCEVSMSQSPSGIDGISNGGAMEDAPHLWIRR